MFLDRHLARFAHRCFVGRRVEFAAVALHGGLMALRIGLQALQGLLLLIESVLVSFGDHRKLHMVK